MVRACLTRGSVTNGTGAAARPTPILATMQGPSPHAQSADRSDYLALAAGIATIAAVAIASLLAVTGPQAGVTPTASALHLGAVALFALAFLPVAGPWRSERLDALAPWALGVAVAAAALAVLTLPQFGLSPVLFILSTAMAAYVLPARGAWALITAQTLVVLGATLRVQPEPLAAVVQSVAYGGFQVFALATTLALVTERTLRQRLALANAELRATRSLLETSSRHGERLRIARDLHDLIGHHLTALALQLEVAEHLAEGRAKESVERARLVARLLLSDVRHVVADLRSQSVDLNEQIRTLVASLPGPRISLDLPDDGGVHDEERALAALRVVQEGLTNALRHGAPHHVSVTLTRDPDGLSISVRDDGSGCAAVEPGNGLRGMRERLERLGGTLHYATRPGAGFSIDARLPLAERP